MDINKTTFANSNQTNQLLLNAIRSKFENQLPAEESSFSPPKFNIPVLKIAGGNGLENINSNDVNLRTAQSINNNTSTQLNQSLLRQLQEKHKNELSTRQSVYKEEKIISSLCNKTAVKYELPQLKIHAHSSNVDSVTKAIDNLKVQETVCAHNENTVKATPITIDLTTALANKFQTHHNTPSNRELIKTQQRCSEIDFDIPFIECDRLDLTGKHKIILPATNEYCVTDVSKLLKQPTLAEPSVIGEYLSIAGDKYLKPSPLKYLTPQFRLQKVKHSVEPFDFDTKSPDDLVLLAISKNQRRRYN